MTTKAIYDGLTNAGYTLKVAHPVTRVSQILSASHKFQTQRDKGWSLKGNASPGIEEKQDRSAHGLI